MNELIFKPYDAVDPQRILQVRVEKALEEKAVDDGVIDNIAAMASREHSDASRSGHYKRATGRCCRNPIRKTY